jgi:hypothetical protein
VLELHGFLSELRAAFFVAEIRMPANFTSAYLIFAGTLSMVATQDPPAKKRAAAAR